MLAQKGPGNIADYFSVQSCLWTVGQLCTGIFLMQCWHRQIKTTLYRLFSCKNMSVCQMYLDNIDETIFPCNVVPAWLIQHCLGYFPHKSCLLAMGQHCTGKNLVQCCPRGFRQHCTRKNPFPCLNSLVTTFQR